MMMPRLPLNQMVPGHCVVTPSSSPSVEYQVRTSQLGVVVSWRSEGGDSQGDVEQTSMMGTLRRRANKPSSRARCTDTGDLTVTLVDRLESIFISADTTVL